MTIAVPALSVFTVTADASRITIAAFVVAAVRLAASVSRSMPSGAVSVSSPPVTFRLAPLPSVIAPAARVSVTAPVPAFTVFPTQAVRLANDDRGIRARRGQVVTVVSRSTPVAPGRIQRSRRHVSRPLRLHP